MKDINPKVIQNDVAQICSAVMTEVIPRVNDANHEIRALQGRLTALEARFGKVAAATPKPTAKEPEGFSDLPKKIADVLREAGYADRAAAQEASDEELLAVSGIGMKALKTIRA